MKEQVVDIVFSQTPDVKVRVIKQDDDEKTKNIYLQGFPDSSVVKICLTMQET